MQEWMIAMLVISIMLIIRDMAKNYFSRKICRIQKNCRLCRRAILRKERVEKYAASFSETGRYFLRECLIGKII